MAHKNFSNVQAVDSELKVIHGNFTAANGANGSACEGCIVSATRSAEGVYDLVLRNSYPGTDKDGKTTVRFADVQVVGDAGDTGTVSALNVEAKTASVQLWTVLGVADDCDAKVVRLRYEVRNTTARRSR